MFFDDRFFCFLWEFFFFRCVRSLTILFFVFFFGGVCAFFDDPFFCGSFFFFCVCVL